MRWVAAIALALAACGKGDRKPSEELPAKAPDAAAAPVDPLAGPPLPGATITMGTRRFRPGTRLENIRFVGPDRLAGKDGDRVVTIDVRTGVIATVEQPSAELLDQLAEPMQPDDGVSGYEAHSADLQRVARELVDTDDDNGTDVRIFRANEDRITTFHVTRDLRAIAYAADSRTVLTGDEHGRIEAWSDDGVVLWSAETGDWTLDIVPSPDGRWIAVTTTDETVRVIDVATHTTIDPGEGHVGPVTHLVWAGERLVSAGEDEVLRWWDPASGREVLHTVLGGEARALAAGAGGAVHVQVEWELDAPRSFADGNGSTILGYAVETWSPSALRTARVEVDDRLAGLTLGADGKLRALDRGTVYELDAATGVTRRLSGRHQWVDAAALSTDGSRAAFSKRGEVLLAGGVADVRVPSKDCSVIQGVALTPRGDRLLVIDGMSTLRVWKDDGTLVASRHLRAIGSSGAVTPDASLALFLASDGLLVIDVESGRARKVALPRASALAFDADGSRLAIGMRDGRIGVWSFADLLAVAIEHPVTPGDLPVDDKPCRKDGPLSDPGMLMTVEPDSDVGADLGKQLLEAK